MKKLSDLLLTCSAAFVFFSSPWLSAQDGKVSLTPKWLAGKTYVIEQDMNTVTKVPIPGAPEDAEQKMDMKMGMEITVTQAGAEKKVALSFTDMKMNMDMAGQKMTMDAKDPAQKAMMGAILDLKPVMVYDNDNNFVRLENLDAAAAGPMAKMLDPASLKQMVNGSLETMPKEPIAVGHTWESTIKIPMEGLGEMGVTSNFEFVKMEKVDGHDCAVISFEGELTGDMKADQGIKITFEEGLFTGTFHFDPELGYMRKQVSRNRFVMKMAIPNQPEMTMPMNQTQVVTLVEVKDS